MSRWLPTLGRHDGKFGQRRTLNTSRKFSSRIWWKLYLPDIGICWGGHPSHSDQIIRMEFMNRASTARPTKARQGYDKQPKRWMKVGWYAEYMKNEWGQTTQRSLSEMLRWKRSY